MKNLQSTFNYDSNKKAFDLKHRKTINYNISQYKSSFDKRLETFPDLENAKAKAENIKKQVINNLDKYLLEFEKNFSLKGGKVIWANDKNEALESLINIFKDNDVKSVVKSKSMTTEEIELLTFLEANGVEAVETDLGEFIVQISNDKPYHIVTPAMHLSSKDVAGIYKNKFDLPADSKPEEITLFTRKILREKFLKADAAVTGANFLISDIGGISLTENEGNGVMSLSWPKIHVVIAGIEKLIPSIKDLSLFLPLLSAHGTGQNLSVYNSIVSPEKEKDKELSLNKMYVILLDNGRTNVLNQIPQRNALSCIRCGACLNACPVYRNIGGHSYNTVYSGPIGSVISPLMKNLKNYKHLSYASSLCGSCKDVCPVKIDIPKLLLYNRNISVSNGYNPKIEKVSMLAWKKAMKNRKLIDGFPFNLKKMGFKIIMKKLWGKRRAIPQMNSKSYAKMFEKN